MDRESAYVSAGVQLTIVGVWWSLASSGSVSVLGDGMVILGTIIVAWKIIQTF